MADNLERESLMGGYSNIQEKSGWRGLWERIQRMPWIYKLVLLAGIFLVVVVVVLAVALPGMRLESNFLTIICYILLLLLSSIH